MSIDDWFSLILRSCAAAAWTWRFWRWAPPPNPRVVVGSLALLLVVIAVGGAASQFHWLPGETIRTLYTGTTVFLLLAAVAAW